MLTRNSFLTILFPICCISCGKQGGYLCSTCKKSIITHPSICPVCYRATTNFKTCFSCKENYPLTACIIGFSYAGAIKKLIHLLKYRHIHTVSSFLAQQLARHIHTYPALGSDVVICPIPTHRWKVTMQRGYDHIELMSREIAQQTGYRHQLLLTKTRYTSSQVGLSKAKRHKNVQRSFCILPNARLVGNETILLADDLFTSGATLTTAANCLLHRRPALTIIGCVLSRNMGI